MKFKGIFIVFNVVVVFSFLFIFLMPLFVLDAPAYGMFLSGNWYLAIAFIAIIGVLNAFFLFNWKMFVLLEREDWSGLNALLQETIFEKKRYSSRNVKLFINTALLLSDTASIERLERELRKARPSLVAQNAALFGVTYLLKNQYESSVAFFREFAGRKDVRERGWISFDLAFANASAKHYDEAVETMLAAWTDFREPVLKVLALYILDSVKTQAGTMLRERSVETISRDREALRKRYSAQAWDKEIEKAKTDVHVVILSRLADDATKWLYGEKAEPSVP